MKKDDLIKTLQAIEGNPEVMLWNGYVGDVMPIKHDIAKSKLYRYTKKFCEQYAAHYHCTDEQLKRMIKNRMFEYQEYTPEDESIYETKEVLIIDAKPSGKKMCDRLGVVEY